MDNTKNLQEVLILTILCYHGHHSIVTAYSSDVGLCYGYYYQDTALFTNYNNKNCTAYMRLSVISVKSWL